MSTIIMLRLGVLLLLLGVTGYLLARRALGLRCSLAVIGMTAFAGTALLMIAANALGYILPIRTASMATVPLLVAICALCLRLPRPDPLDAAPRWLLWTLGILGLLGGWATARFMTSDLWTWGQLPVSATVMAGNFPIVEPVNPSHSLGYHYGAQFLAAVTSLITGVSLATSYNLQPFVGFTGALFLAAAAARRMTRSWLAVLLATLLFLGASGLEWLHLFDLAADLFMAWTGELATNPFRNLAPTFANTFGPSLLIAFGSRTYTLGVPSLLGVLLMIDICWYTSSKHRALLTGAMGILFCLALALTAETALVLLGASAVVTTMLRHWWTADREPPLRSMGATVIGIFACAVIGSALQGGVLTEALRGSQVSPGSFEWSNAMLPAAFPAGPYYGPWEWPFLRSVGLPFLLLPVAILIAWRRRSQPLVVLFAGLMVSHALTPFIIRYGPRHNEMIRLLYIALACSGMFLGLAIGEGWQRFGAKMRLLAGAALLAMLLSSAIYLPMRLLLPTFRLEAAPAFASLPTGTPEQQAMYAWVRGHSSLSDWFYTRTLPGDPFAVDPVERVEDRSEEENQMRERMLFMMHTGRYNVGFLHWGNFTPYQRAQEERFERSCAPDAFAAMGTRYLVIEFPERGAWFDAVCKPEDWNLWYPQDKAAFPRIYRHSGGDTEAEKGIH